MSEYTSYHTMAMARLWPVSRPAGHTEPTNL